MNEQIKQLALEAKLPSHVLEYGTELCLAPHLEKFAELIVGECMEQVWYTREEMFDDTIIRNIRARMAKHFGVEE